MIDWYFDHLNDRYKQKNGEAEISAHYLMLEIEKLDPHRSWYNTDERINGLLNSIAKKALEPDEGDVLTKVEKQIIMEMAERCAGVPKGEKMGRWTHEDRVMVVYSVLCSLYRLSAKKKK